MGVISEDAVREALRVHQDTHGENVCGRMQNKAEANIQET